MAYSLDTTGLAPSNYVAIETHLVTPQSLANYAYILLNHGPFFGNNLQVTYTPRNGLSIVLSLGEDYQPIFELEGFGDTTSTKVWGAISLTNPALLGSIQVSYQSLGGNWTFSNATIFAYLNSNYFDAATQRIVLVSNGFLRLPNNPTVDWPINSRQSVAIAQAQLPVVDLVVKYEYIDNATQAQVATPGSLTNPLYVATTNQRALQPISALTLPLPSNAAKETGGVLASMAQTLLEQRTATGTIADPSYNGTGPSTVVSALKGIFEGVTDLSMNFSAWQQTQGGGGGQTNLTIEGGNLVALKTDSSATTQPISVAALPLPQGAATETGNLLSIKNNTQSLSQAAGATNDAPYIQGENGSIIALLKTIEAKLYTTTAAAANNATLAKESGGNLDSIVTELTSLAAAIGQTSSASVSNLGTSNLIALLKGIYERSSSSFSSSVDYSGVISSAATNYAALPANSARRFLQIQNTHATALLYLNFASAAYIGSGNQYTGFVLTPGDTATYDITVPTSQINLASATAGATYFVIEG